jgi:hypothetical protein
MVSGALRALAVLLVVSCLGRSAKVEFKNDADVDVDVHWLDEKSSTYHFLTTVQSGLAGALNTFKGHKFLVAEKGREVDFATDKPNHVQLKPDHVSPSSCFEWDALESYELDARVSGRGHHGYCAGAEPVGRREGEVEAQQRAPPVEPQRHDDPVQRQRHLPQQRWRHAACVLAQQGQAGVHQAGEGRPLAAARSPFPSVLSPQCLFCLVQISLEAGKEKAINTFRGHEMLVVRDRQPVTWASEPNHVQTNNFQVWRAPQ